MSSAESLQLFEDQPIRTAWDVEAEEWFFSIVDVVGVLTESPNPQVYWRVLINVSKMREMKPLQTVTL